MPIAFVAHDQSAVAGSAATIVSSAHAISAGDTIVMCVSWNGPRQNVQEVTDTAGNIYREAIGHQAVGVAIGAAGASIAIWVAKNCAAHATNVTTATFSGTPNFRGFQWLQYSGADADQPIDVWTQVATDAAPATITTPAFTTTDADALIICYARHSGANPAMTLPVAYAQRTTLVPTYYDQCWDRQLSSMVTGETVTLTPNGAGASLVVVVLAATRRTNVIQRTSSAFLNDPGSVTSVTLTPFTCLSGELVVFGVSWDNAETIDDISDDAGNTYTVIDTRISGGAHASLIYGNNVTGQVANVITVTFTGTVDTVTAALVQFDGVNSSAAYNTTAHGESNAPTTTTDFTTTFDQEVIINYAAGIALTGGYGSVDDVSRLYAEANDETTGSSWILTRVTTVTATADATVVTSSPAATATISLVATFRGASEGPDPQPVTYHMRVVRRVGPIAGPALQWVFWNRIQLDLETGTTPLNTGLGSDPIVMCRYSDDSGYTWSNEFQMSIGRIGQYSYRAQRYSTGRSRNRVWEFVVTDPVPVRFLQLVADVDYGSS